MPCPLCLHLLFISCPLCLHFQFYLFHYKLDEITMTCYIGHKKADDFKTSSFSVACLLSVPHLLCQCLLSFETCLLFVFCPFCLRFLFSMACLLFVLYLLRLHLLFSMTGLLFVPHLLHLRLPSSMACLIYFYIINLNQGHLR